jgi:8-oxo-dGTP pyrophosphatase MutT (NUDIX family)
VSRTVRSASTVVLLRDGRDGIETFLMRRVASMAFAPRMHVFPGGRVDEIDETAPVTLVGADLEALALRASTDVAELHALYSCAVRETREETGVELATIGCDGSLLIDPGALPLVDHWVTPEGETRRYDVRFFAAMLVGEDARLTTTEADEVLWIRPVDALASFAAGRLPMLPPTESVLTWLTHFDSSSQALIAGAARDVIPLLPRQVTDASGAARWVIAHDRTGEILIDPHPAPHTRESDGLPRVDG